MCEQERLTYALFIQAKQKQNPVADIASFSNLIDDCNRKHRGDVL